MPIPNDPHNSFHRDIQANLAQLAHIDAMLADLDRKQADGEALTARVIAAGAKVTRSELIATCQRLCLGLPPDDFAPLPALDCESISATQKMLREIVGARVELRAIAKSNARIVALLERSAFSEGEPINVSLEKTENQVTGEQKTTDDLISEVDRLRAVVCDLHLEVKAILSAAQPRLDLKTPASESTASSRSAGIVE